MMTAPKQISVLARRLDRFVRLTDAEITFLAAMQSAPMVITRGKQLIDEGQTRQHAYVLHSGWACNYKDLANGRRQVISFPIAGDCVGLRSTLLQTADHSASVLTDVVVSVIEAARVRKCVDEFPRLAAAILWAASRDEAMVVEHLVNVGRRSALERTAHFFVELTERHQLIGQAGEAEFKCPLNQFVLADALGLTAIHVNRVLRQLRVEKLLTLRKGVVVIHDMVKLRDLAGYQGGYLDREP